MNVKSVIFRFLNQLKAGPKPGVIEKEDYKEKRKSNRVGLEPTDIFLIDFFDENKKIIASGKIRNISLRGFRFAELNGQPDLLMKPGQVLDANLKAPDLEVTLKLETRWWNDEKKEGACQLLPPFPRDLQLLERFLEPRCLGASLREINTGYLNEPEKGSFRWFQGINDTHLFCWLDPSTGQVQHQQLVFLDRVLEWRANSGLQSGRVKTDSQRDRTDIRWASSELIEYDDRLDWQLVEDSKALLNASHIDNDLKSKFIKKD